MTEAQTLATEIPAHIPDNLVRDYDFRADLVDVADSYVEFKKLHDGPDIFYTPKQGGHWVLTRFEDMEYFFKNPNDELSSLNALIPKGARPLSILPLESDPPLTHDYRQILMPFVTPKAIKALEGQVIELTQQLIDNVYEQGGCDFVADFAQTLPITIIMRLANLPDEDVPMLLEYCAAFFHTQSPEAQMEGTQKLVGYVAQKLAERKENLGDDILSAILKGTVEGGRPLNEMEILGLGAVVILGGLDTAAAMMGWIGKFLAENPDKRQELIDSPELINPALEELFRRYHIGSLAREVRDDFVYKGVSFKKGEMVLLPTVVAGLDERQYDKPFDVDFGRKDNAHLLFGGGAHMCLGSRLARYEIRTFMVEWLKKIPEFTVAPNHQQEYITGITHSLKSLPLTWDVK